eukprot:6962657-Prymnesium_polylepis.1
MGGRREGGGQCDRGWTGGERRRSVRSGARRLAVAWNKRMPLVQNATIALQEAQLQCAQRRHGRESREVRARAA